MSGAPYEGSLLVLRGKKMTKTTVEMEGSYRVTEQGLT